MEKHEEPMVVTDERVVRTEFPSEAELQRTMTVDVDNYHGLSVKMVLVYISILFITFAQLVNLVGCGAFARDIAAAVGGAAIDAWLSQAFVILGVAFGIPISQAADLWGRKWFLTLLTMLAAIGTLITSRCTSMGMAIAGQILVGIGCSVQPLLYAIPSEILPRRYRAAAQSGLTAVNGLAGVFALLAGSEMVAKFNEGWRDFWYLVTAMLAVASIICLFCYNPPPRALQLELTTREKLARLDWVGYGLLALATTLIVMGFVWADNPYPWKSAHVLAPLLTGVAALVALVVFEARFKKDGIFHHDLFSIDRNFALCLFILFIDGASFFAVNEYYAFEMSVIFETDPERVGLRFCILFFAAMVSAVAMGAISSWLKILREPVILSFALFVAFFGAMTSVTTGSSTAVWIYPNIAGIATGLSLTCLVPIAQFGTPLGFISLTSGLVISIRSFGGSIGFGIYSSIFDSAISKNLPAYIAAAVVPLGLPASSLPAFITALSADDVKALTAVPGVSPEIIAAGALGLQNAYLKSFQGVWIAGAAFAACAVIAACFLVKPTHISMHVDAPLDKADAQKINDAILQHDAVLRQDHEHDQAHGKV